MGPEVIVASRAAISCLYTNSSSLGHIAFSNRTTILAPSGGSPFKAIVADIDGDEKPDIVATNSYLNTVSVYLNTTPPAVRSRLLPMQTSPQATFPKAPLSVISRGWSAGSCRRQQLRQHAVRVSQYEYRRQYRVFSTGDRQLGRLCIRPSDRRLRRRWQTRHRVDDQFNNTVSVHRNVSTPGTVSINPNVDYSVGSFPYSITTADFDGDGKPDLATANDGDNTFSVLRNRSSSEPAIASFTPASGTTGTLVTIIGINLTGLSGVSFGDSAAASFTYVSPDTVTAVVGGGATGAVSLVAAAGGTSLAGFTYGMLPVITGFTPNSAALGGHVTISGKGFTTATTVLFGGTPAHPLP